MDRDIQASVEQLRAELRAEMQAELRQEVARLRDELHSDSGVTGEPVITQDGRSQRASDRVMSRRGALLLGTAAAVTAGMAVETVAMAQPAAATQGAFEFGTTNDAGTDFTSLTSTNADETLAIYNTGGGAGLIVGDNLTGTGAGLVAVLENSANTSAALNGSTGGTGAGVSALSAGGYGVDTTGLLAPLHLGPAALPGAPTTGAHQLGELYVDSNGLLYRCVVADTPGTWTVLNSVVPLAAPVRVIDTRNATGGITGPISANTTYTSSAITGASGVPVGALAVVGTLTMVAPATTEDLPGHGYMAIFPGGTTNPGTSNVNAGTSYSIATGVTVGLGTGSAAGKVSLFVGGLTTQVHAVLDVAAYII